MPKALDVEKNRDAQQEGCVDAKGRREREEHGGSLWWAWATGLDCLGTLGEVTLNRYKD